MLQVEAAQTCFHRGLAVGRGPGCAQTAVAARPKMQRALALFLEDELVIDEAAVAAGPIPPVRYRRSRARWHRRPTLRCRASPRWREAPHARSGKIRTMTAARWS